MKYGVRLFVGLWLAFFSVGFLLPYTRYPAVGRGFDPEFRHFMFSGLASAGITTVAVALADRFRRDRD